MAKDSSKKRVAKPAYFDNPLRMVRPGIAALKVNAGTILWLILTPLIASLPFFFLIILVAAYFGGRAAQLWTSITFTVVSLTLYAFMITLGVYVVFGLTLAALRSADGEKLSYWSVYKLGRRYFWRFAGLLLSVTVIVLAGLVLLIVPGVILLKRYFLAPFYMVDKDLGVFDAMRASAEETRETGGVWPLLAAYLVISLPAAIPGIGWLVSVALSILYTCVPGMRYREIQQVLATRARKAAEKEAAVKPATPETDSAVSAAPAAIGKSQPPTPKRAQTPGRKKPSRRARKAGKATNR